MMQYADIAEKGLSLLPPDELVMRSRFIASIGHAKYEMGLFHETEKWISEVYKMGQQADEASIIAITLVLLFETYHLSHDHRGSRRSGSLHGLPAASCERAGAYPATTGTAISRQGMKQVDGRYKPI
jgi:hypothetical protein